ncbi:MULTISPECIES: nuclear transport factor 2 family protein [Salipiger]|uniref:nuclear transport factor 2 family protein n=1 Tax=Salipiger TaxID=263377 RepID=UPI003514368E
MTDLADQVAALAAEVTRLRDHEAIRQAVYAYARGVDRGDATLLDPAFHDDAEDDHGNFRGSKADAMAALAKSAANPAVTASVHHIGNILIDLRGDVADVETYFMASQRREEDGRLWTRMRVGRYLDHFVKRDGAWRVLSRKVIDDWSRLDEVVQTAREVGPENNHCSRGPDDPSHAVTGFADLHRHPHARRSSED